jgi:hypothetical protein
VHDVTSKDTLLDWDLLDRRISGTTDVVISSTDEEEHILHNAHIIFELRNPQNSKNKLKQTALKLMAVQPRSSFVVIAVLTDLVDSWHILWFEKSKDNEHERGSLVTTKLNRGQAVGFLRYHLQILKLMRNDHFTRVRFHYDPDYDEGGDRDDSYKKRRLIERCRPTFKSADVMNLPLSTVTNHVNENQPDEPLTSEQRWRCAIMRFIRDNPNSDLRWPKYLSMSVDVEE